MRQKHKKIPDNFSVHYVYNTMRHKLFYELIAFGKRNLRKRAGIINFVVKIYTWNLFYLTPNLLQIILHKTYISEIFFALNFFLFILKKFRIVWINI